MVRYAGAAWWLHSLILLVGHVSSGSYNSAWAAEVVDANDYAWASAIGSIEVDKQNDKDKEKESANKEKNDDKDKNDDTGGPDNKADDKDKNDDKGGPDNKADDPKDAGSIEVDLWSMPEAIANITGQAPIVDWEKYLRKDPFGEEDGVGPVAVNDFVGGSTWPFTTKCLSGEKMEVSHYEQELCIGVGEGVCIDGWNFGIRYHDLNTYVMLWKDHDDGKAAYKWFPGALQLCIGEQRLFGGHKPDKNDQYKSPSVEYLRVVYDNCHYYLIGPGSIDAGKFAKLKISEDKEKDKPLEVKFSKLWKIHANGQAETSPDAIWYPIPCESWYFGSSNPNDLISLRGPSYENNALSTTIPVSSPTSNQPTKSPSTAPVSAPPTRGPSSSPESESPTSRPSTSPVSNSPTKGPSSSPESERPTPGPSSAPVSTFPTQGPSSSPLSGSPTPGPSASPVSNFPTKRPSSASPVSDTSTPTVGPSASPISSSPTKQPISSPVSNSPTVKPSTSPISNSPTKGPSTSPTKVPSTASPTKLPSKAPVTGAPTKKPSASPTAAPVSTPPTAAPATPGPSSGPTKAPVSISTPSPTVKTSANLRTGTTEANPEPAGYELAMTTPKEAWMWTRDYSTCNRRLEVWEDQEDGESLAANNQKGFRWGFKNRFGEGGDGTGGGDEDEEVGDDIGAHTNNQDDMDYAVLGERSKEIRTSERVFDFGGDDIVEVDMNDKDDKGDKPAGNGIDADEAKANKENGMACTPAVIPEGRASTIPITATQTCPSKFSPFSGPATVSRLDGKTVRESSGICASRINPNTIWSINDYSNQATLHAVNSTDGSVRQYPIALGRNYDYEDIACGPGPIPDVAYIYAADIGDNLARRGFKYYFGRLTWQPVIIYRVREPNLSTLQDSELTQWDKLELDYSDGPHNAEAMMIDPVSRRIFILTKSSGTIWMTPREWGAGDAKMTLTKVGMIKTMPYFLTGIDISPDGKEIVVKFYTHIYYFCLGSRQYDNPEDAWQEVVKVLNTESGIKVPYIAEPQGEAVCFGSTFNGGIYTLSEAQDREFVPLIHHERL